MFIKELEREKHIKSHKFVEARFLKIESYEFFTCVQMYLYGIRTQFTVTGTHISAYVYTKHTLTNALGETFNLFAPLTYV